jgi:anti-sigma-K factor RskA
MTRDINHYRELLPEYVNGLLDAQTKADLEKQIQADDDLKKELEELNQLKQSYSSLSETIQGPSLKAFPRIMENIESLENPGRNRQIISQSDMVGVRQWIEILRDWMAVPKNAWAFASIQMAVIVVMAVVLFSSPADHTYQTLSTGSPLSGPVVHINVVFEGTAMEKEIRDLLTGIHAGIVDGPGQTGLYVIAVSEDQPVDQVLMQLKNAGIIKFVQKKM